MKDEVQVIGESEDSSKNFGLCLILAGEAIHVLEDLQKIILASSPPGPKKE